MEAALCGNLASAVIEELGEDLPDQETEWLVLECFRIEEAYYREAGEPYDLAVWLVNQLQFLRRNASAHIEEIQSKYREAAKLAQTYSMGNIIEFLQGFSREFS